MVYSVSTRCSAPSRHKAPIPSDLFSGIEDQGAGDVLSMETERSAESCLRKGVSASKHHPEQNSYRGPEEEGDDRRKQRR